MAGTSDAREIIKFFSSIEDITVLATATTRHGTDLGQSSGADKVLEGRFNSDELVKIIKENNIQLLVDVTHPFASLATQNAIIAAETSGVQYMRFERPPTELPDNELLHKCSSFESAVREILKILNQTEDHQGQIFHLAGVNTLHYLTSKIDPKMIVARVLPSVYSVKKCLELGISHNNIIAMEGTFSPELNRVLMKEFDIGIVLTKESGQSGGTKSKIQSALDSNIPIVIVMRPELVELQGKPVFDDAKSLCDAVLSLL